MEHVLACNNLKCRSQLTHQALVTTCRSELPTPQDATITNLKPTEEYKTSVLSGLSPNIIMECAGRALSFWAYQTTQDIYYHQHLYQTLADKYSDLHVHLEKTMNDSNAQIERLQEKVNAMAAEQENVRRRNEDISQAYREKSKRLLQVQELYDKVKCKAEMFHIEHAASEAVASTVHNTTHQANDCYIGSEHDRSLLIKNDDIPVYKKAHFSSAGGMGSHRVSHIRHDGKEHGLGAGNPHQETSSTPSGGRTTKRIGSTTLMEGYNLDRYAGPAVHGRNSGQNDQLNNATNFVGNQTALPGI
ncbi:E3 ubiquitin-protein ligase CCNP1IP1 [Geosmithia morbida]|uniref:E3 ubiquitin-protein ligase CCNP1IP1 n=1 Tax=Geosmithia morbida TaxID=1094350 RepID=A0A9P4Z0B8_9HYPO|nr:E3 ubiquitin-protein ligase CCNP1IP1 [Geosmithia morbida]KAF4125350.1 E3 ubiquitin-protein ligase CCNP1IP1 [Geosmithia morbida]